jgi:hypothetical protein
VAGVPARVVRTLSKDEIGVTLEGIEGYHRLTKRSLESIKEVEALEVEAPNRKTFRTYST